ncbi:MAG: S1 RNA-binding domain-containing protein, partial [Calditrichae bacterium]|nr:S1 RNA-binding domain-containing protein [Calditrichia bacterium]NIW78694.1 S1 RNA-binding domain-containing protein [Calditrichia bacterium]
FAEFMPGKEGLIHISELSNHRVAKVSDVVKVGDVVGVVLKKIDREGRYNLSHKEYLFRHKKEKQY